MLEHSPSRIITHSQRDCFLKIDPLSETTVASSAAQSAPICMVKFDAAMVDGLGRESHPYLFKRHILACSNFMMRLKSLPNQDQQTSHAPLGDIRIDQSVQPTMSTMLLCVPADGESGSECGYVCESQLVQERSGSYAPLRNSRESVAKKKNDISGIELLCE